MAIHINKIAMSLALMATAGSATAAAKPNILAIMGDDIGYWNISAYNQGMMGYQTPNLDRIASEGAIFTDHYGQQSCTAGRAAFVPYRSVDHRHAGLYPRYCGVDSHHR